MCLARIRSWSRLGVRAAGRVEHELRVGQVTASVTAAVPEPESNRDSEPESTRYSYLSELGHLSRSLPGHVPQA